MHIEKILTTRPTIQPRYANIAHIYHPGVKLKEISRCIDVFYRTINDNHLFRPKNTTKLVEKINSIALENIQIKNSREDLVCYGPHSLASYISHFHTKYDGSLHLKNISIDFGNNMVETRWLGNDKFGNHIFYLNDYCDRIIYLEF